MYPRSPLYILIVYPYTHAFDRKRKREGKHSEEGTKAEFTHVLMAMLQPFGLNEEPRKHPEIQLREHSRHCLLIRRFAAVEFTLAVHYRSSKVPSRLVHRACPSRPLTLTLSL
jgi:hypothetical protein